MCNRTDVYAWRFSFSIAWGKRARVRLERAKGLASKEVSSRLLKFPRLSDAKPRLIAKIRIRRSRENRDIFSLLPPAVVPALNATESPGAIRDVSVRSTTLAR